ncbi:MAG: hypothetical protein R2939_18570 [Kofleriaceae bacterium]
MLARWYRIAVIDDGRLRQVAASAPHLGAALDQVTRRHPRAVAIAATPLRPDLVPLGESIGKGLVALPDAPEAGAAPAAVGARWPAGVLPTWEVDAPRPPPPVLGWTRHPAPALVLEAQADGARTVELFLSLAEALPAIDNIELTVRGHYDGAGGADEVWLTPRLDARKAMRFLDDHDRELLGNGHVDVALYVRAERSTLRLTEHKTLVWTSDEPATEARLVTALAGAGLEPLPALPTVAARAHVHYREPRSSERARLLTRLHAMRLRRVASR